MDDFQKQMLQEIARTWAAIDERMLQARRRDPPLDPATSFKEGQKSWPYPMGTFSSEGEG